MLSKINRLKKTADFRKIFKEGRLIGGQLMNLRFTANHLSHCRFGFLVSLKVSKKSTYRNKIKRQLKEIGRSSLKQIKPGYDLILVTKPKIVLASQKQINADFKNVIEKANLYI